MNKSTLSHLEIYTAIPRPLDCAAKAAHVPKMDHQLPSSPGEQSVPGQSRHARAPLRPQLNPVPPLPLSPPCIAWKSAALDGVQTSLQFYRLFRNGSYNSKGIAEQRVSGSRGGSNVG